MISLRDVSKTYHHSQTPAVNSISLILIPGELLSLVGESGCGKTTTLKMINRLIEPTSGEIEIDGRLISSYEPTLLRRSIGYVIQDFGLFPHYTVAENIAIVPRLESWPTDKTNRRVTELLEMVGLSTSDFRNKFPGELSGGQAQRVALARALAAEPKIMLMDEPFGALDPITRADTIEQFNRLRRELNLTVILVTHDMAEALILSDRIAIMKAGEVLACDRPAKLLTQQTVGYAADLLATPIKQAEMLRRIRTEGSADER